MLKTMRKHGVTLALFAAGSTGLTAAINQLTKHTIDDQAEKQQQLGTINPADPLLTSGKSLFISIDLHKALIREEKKKDHHQILGKQGAKCKA